MLDFGVAASEIFRILHSFDYEVDAFDGDGQRVYEPETARRFFARPVNLLVSLVDDNENSAVRLYTGKNTDVADVFGLSQSLRTMATKYNLLFNMREWEREISPKTFATNASVRESKEEDMLIEGMYGTSRSSYLKLENARMIVRHRKPINEAALGARSRNISKIFIENAEGERTLFPVNSIAAARSMTQHVNHGGSFYDEVGSHIMRMTQDYGNLAKAARYVSSNSGSLSESAMPVKEACRARMKEMKHVFERLYRAYESEHAKLDLTPLNETDCSTDIESLKEMMTLGEKCLDEQVLRTVAETMATRTLSETGADDAEVMDSVRVFGRMVDRSAWDKLRVGVIEFNRKPVINTLEFPSEIVGLSHYLSEIAPYVKNDSLVNLMGYVADALHLTRDRETLRKMRIFGALVKRAAGVSSAPASQAVREFEEWVGSHSPDNVLAERDPDSAASARIDDMMAEANDRAVDEFQVSEFLDSDWGSEFASSIADGELESDEKTFDKAYILSALEGYLEDWIARNESGLEDVTADASVAASAVWNEVATHLSEGGLVINEGAEFSKEDILFPPDGEDDVDIIDECDCDKDDELSRIKSLAGVR